MSSYQQDVYLLNCQDRTVESSDGGEARTYVITPKDYWGLGLGMRQFIVGLRINQPKSPQFRVTLKWQWSLDGQVWVTGPTLLGNITAPGDHKGSLASQSDMLPFGRVVAEVDAASGTAQESALVTVWGLYKFSS